MAGTKREKSPGSWQLVVTLGTDYRGKKKRYYKTVRGSEVDAERELALFYADCIRGNTAPGSDMTIEQAVNSYINDRPKGSLKANTLQGYHSTANHIIFPYIGNLRLKKATVRTLQQWVDDIASEYSPKTVKNAKSLLRSSFDRLVRFGEMDANPCDKLIMPKRERKEAKYYTKDETALFIDALQSMDRTEIVSKVLFELALFCGMRRGEILGLDWQDIDLNNHTVTIRQTRYTENNGVRRVDTPKTDASKRTLYFPKEMRSDFVTLASYYSEQKLALGTYWTDSNAVIRGNNGAPLNDSEPSKRLHRFQDKHGLKRITLHQLRHTNVSTMISLGYDIKTVQKHAGHADSGTTLNIYGHLFEEQGEQIASDIFDAMSR